MGLIISWCCLVVSFQFSRVGNSSDALQLPKNLDDDDTLVSHIDCQSGMWTWRIDFRHFWHRHSRWDFASPVAATRFNQLYLVWVTHPYVCVYTNCTSHQITKLKIGALKKGVSSTHTHTRFILVADASVMVSGTQSPHSTCSLSAAGAGSRCVARDSTRGGGGVLYLDQISWSLTGRFIVQSVILHQYQEGNVLQYPLDVQILSWIFFTMPVASQFSHGRHRDYLDILLALPNTFLITWWPNQPLNQMISIRSHSSNSGKHHLVSLACTINPNPASSARIFFDLKILHTNRIQNSCSPKH